MKKTSTSFLVILSCLVPFTGHAAEKTDFSKPFKVALMCFKSGEQTSGMNKICYYNCAGSEAATTVKSYDLCPLSIDR